MLNGNDEGAALHANDVGMDKWEGGKMDYYFKNTKEGCKLYFDPDKWGGKMDYYFKNTQKGYKSYFDL